MTKHSLLIALVLVCNLDAPALALVQNEIVITELMPDPSSVTDANGEWFEIVSATTMDLRGLRVETGSGSFFVVAGADPVTIQQGEYFLFARNADPLANGGLPNVQYAYGSGAPLVNSSSSLTLSIGGFTINSVTYVTAPAGKSLQVAPNGSVQSENSILYNATDFGTPRGANSIQSIMPVPEPMSGVLMLAGLALFGRALRPRSAEAQFERAKGIVPELLG